MADDDGRGTKRKKLSVDIPDSKTSEPVDGGGKVDEDSFVATDSTFRKGDIAIHRGGVRMRDSPKMFVVNRADLELGDVIGRGSGGYVRVATHRPTSMPLALKVINMFDKDKRDQLLAEIRALYDAQCPSIVTFFGAFYNDGAISIALEYMDGGSLENMLAQVGELPEAVLANLTFQILWGLAYLKEERRVHRDVKPSNILVSSTGRVKLTDFGIAAELKNSIAMCGTFVGTFKYMSPERIRNDPYSFPSDVWSLGLVLIECGTGRYPYPTNESYIEIMQTVLECPEPRLPDGMFSREFNQFIAQCLQKRPEDRLPADILLGSPWLKQCHATSISNAVGNLHHWIMELTGAAGDADGGGAGAAGGAGGGAGDGGGGGGGGNDSSGSTLGSADAGHGGGDGGSGGGSGGAGRRK
eukprot:g5542.t1